MLGYAVTLFKRLPTYTVSITAGYTVALRPLSPYTVGWS
jgi:hypothetical protein